MRRRSILAAVSANVKDSETEIKKAISNILKYAPDKQGAGGRQSTS